jgi:phage regulatory protein, rha family
MLENSKLTTETELVQIQNHKDLGLVVSSRVIAEGLGKRHADVLESIDKILENGNVRSLCIPTTYKVDGQKREYKEYLLTKDGFTLYMFNIQGYNDFKLAYINKFNKMERALQFNTPQTFAEALKLAYEQQLVIEEQKQKLIEAEPKVLNYKGLGRNKLFQYLRDKDILMSGNTPYQKYVDAGYFRLIETTWNTPNNDSMIYLKTVVYQKGLEFLSKVIEKDGYIKNND